MSTAQDTAPAASYWQATAATPSYTTDLPASAEVAVVGGGLLGTTTAYWLARAGAAPVLVERAAPGAGASGRNGGFMVSGTGESYLDTLGRLGRDAARAAWDLTVKNRALLRAVLSEEAIDCDYREPGHLHLALGADQLAQLARTAAALRADGFAVELLDRQATQGLIGTPLGEEIAGALFTAEEGLLHSARLIQGLAAAAQRHGARICAETAVLGLAPEGDGVLLRTSRGELRAGAVVVAANAWSDQVVPALAGLITPVRGQALAYAPMGPVFRTAMSASATPTGEYWQQTLDGSIVLGGCRAVAQGHEMGVRELETTAEVQGAIEQLLPRLFPELGGLRVARRWAGLMAFTPDHLPIADQAPGLPGVWVVGGFNGHGMPFGMRLGQLLARAATSRATPPELAPFRLGRPTL